MTDPAAGAVAKALVARLEALPAVADLVRHLLRALAGKVPAAACYACGGLIRDLAVAELLAIEAELKDVDLMVDRATGADLEAVVGELGRSCPSLVRAQSVGAAFQVFKLRVADLAEPVDLAPARTERSFGPDRAATPSSSDGLTLEQDAGHRDLTLNAIFVELEEDENGGLRGTLRDPTGGLDSIRRREVRCVGDPDGRLREDPLRALRAIRFAVSLPGFEVHPSTAEAIRRHAPRVMDGVARDRLGHELYLALAADPSRALLKLEEVGLLQVMLPELVGLGSAAIARCARRVAGTVQRLRDGTGPTVVFAALLLELAEEDDRLPAIARDLRLPNLRRLTRLCRHTLLLARYPDLEWPEARVEQALGNGDESPLVLALYGGHQEAWERDAVDFAALASGLPVTAIDFGQLVEERSLSPGPALGRLHLAMRQAEIDGAIPDRAAAVELFDRLCGDL